MVAAPYPEVKTCNGRYFPDDDQHIYTITIHEGAYTPDELAIEIATQMNNAAYKCSLAGPKNCALDNPCFVCKYNKVSNTFWFGNNNAPFTLLFGKKETYKDLCPGQVCVWDHHTRWGLPAYLGYKKQNYKWR